MGSNTSRPAKYDTPAYGCLITFLVLTTIAIVARGTSRRLVKAPFWADDGLAILAYVRVSLMIDLVYPASNEGNRCQMPPVSSMKIQVSQEAMFCNLVLTCVSGHRGRIRSVKAHVVYPRRYCIVSKGQYSRI